MAASYLPDWLQSDWKGPQVKLTLPPGSFFQFPPSHEPVTQPPPFRQPSLAYPFNIPEGIYNAALAPNVPITIALVYATVITYLNSVNAERGYKPWAISKTRIFTVGVLLHNLFLAVYSAWTFVGMFNAVRASFVGPSVADGLANTIDCMCKIHGPRGIGSAATYNPATSQWGILNKVYHLSSNYLPERSDVGRLWNEGLAFYGWLFYLSKFYEVIDTLIIIAKGKKSSFLQTYHHAGAMMCMWAGIRYMSPPIWLFVFLNSFVHAIMYTFYFCTALRIRVPKPLKQSLTTVQISQFVVGVIFANAHYFVKYQVPVSLPYVFHVGKKIVEGASALGADAASEFSSALAAATATADGNAWLKKFALRAAGREGLAENVYNNQGVTFGVDAVHAVQDFVSREEVRYRNELQWANCLDTSGQAFAVYLNVLYLMPLTWLFARFFVKSYLKRSGMQRRKSISDHVSVAGQSFADARKHAGRRLSEAFEDSQGWNGDSNGERVIIDGSKVREHLRQLDESMKKKADEVAVEIPGADEARDVVRQGAQKTKDVAQGVYDSIDDLDVQDVLKKAWATVDSSKGKSSSSSSHHTTTSSSRTEVSSTTVFESSSISRSVQDEVIASSSLVRDADVNTKTGKKKQAGSKYTTATDSAIMPITITTRDMSSSMRTQSSSLPNHQPPASSDSDRQHPASNHHQSPSSSSTSESEQQDPLDDFSQTKSASSSAHANPVKPNSTSSSLAYPVVNAGADTGADTDPFNSGSDSGGGYDLKVPDRGRSHRSPARSVSPGKSTWTQSMIPVPKKSSSASSSSDLNIPARQHVPSLPQSQSQKWHSRRRGHVDAEHDAGLGVGLGVSVETSPRLGLKSSVVVAGRSVKSKREEPGGDNGAGDSHIGNGGRSPTYHSRKTFNETRDEIDVVTGEKGDDDSDLL